jgi:hypothetical protein
MLGNVMGNPNAKPPTSTQFKKGEDPKRNAGGRTPVKWLHELLSAANDTSAAGETRREAIGMHLLSIATSWEVKTKGAGESAIQVADAKNAIEAAKLLLGYDMGKPVEAVELSNPDGSMSPSTTVPTPLFSMLENSLRKAEKAAADAELEAHATPEAPETPPSEG